MANLHGYLIVDQKQSNRFLFLDKTLQILDSQFSLKWCAHSRQVRRNRSLVNYPENVLLLCSTPHTVIFNWFLQEITCLLWIHLTYDTRNTIYHNFQQLPRCEIYYFSYKPLSDIFIIKLSWIEHIGYFTGYKLNAGR